MEKTANRLYREYKKKGGTNSFAQWISVEKTHNADGSPSGVFMVNKPLNDSIQPYIKNMQKEGGLTNQLNKNSIFGLNKTAVIAVSSLLVIAVTIYFIEK